MELIEHSLALILAVALVGALALRLSVPLPVLLIGAGVALSFIPHLSEITLDPGIFFLLFIPPLLFADGWQFPKREFVLLRWSIFSLAFGLVFATTLVVGVVVHWMVPSIPLAVAFALGAVVSPTDAVAVEQVTHKLPLPLRLRAVLSGESLINDASGLVAFKFAVAAAVTGTFSLASAAIDVVYVSAAGAFTGFVVAFVIQRLRQLLQRAVMEEPSVQTTLSLLTPFAAYLAAEHVHASGVLAAVAAGIYCGIDDNKHLTLETRLKAWSVWELVLFILNGLVFLLLGLQLPDVVTRLTGHSWPQVLLYSVVLCGTVIAVRLLWAYPGALIAWWLTKRTHPGWQCAPWQSVLLSGWAGIRGAVTLAGALSLPLTAGSAAFPERDLVIFLATSVIVVTLLVNGLTLPLVIRWLGVSDDGVLKREEREARIGVAQAGLAMLQTETPDEADIAFVEALAREYERRVRHATEPGDHEDEEVTARLAAERELTLRALHAERRHLHALRDTHKINEQVLFAIQRELDFKQASLTVGGGAHHG